MLFTSYCQMRRLALTNGRKIHILYTPYIFGNSKQLQRYINDCVLLSSAYDDYSFSALYIFESCVGLHMFVNIFRSVYFDNYIYCENFNYILRES